MLAEWCGVAKRLPQCSTIAASPHASTTASAGIAPTPSASPSLLPPHAHPSAIFHLHPTPPHSCEQNKTSHDFGGEIIPQTAQDHKVQAYLFNDYWEDIGTIESFFNANLALTHNVRQGGREGGCRGWRCCAWSPPHPASAKEGETTGGGRVMVEVGCGGVRQALVATGAAAVFPLAFLPTCSRVPPHTSLNTPPSVLPHNQPLPPTTPLLQPPNFQFHDPQGPIYTSPRFLPPAKVIKSRLTDAIVSHGSYLRECTVNHAIIGLRSRINEGVTIQVG